MSYLWRIIFYIFSDFLILSVIILTVFDWSLSYHPLFHCSVSSLCPHCDLFLDWLHYFFNFFQDDCVSLYIHLRGLCIWMASLMIFIDFYYLKKVCFFAMPLSFHSFSPEEVILLHFLFLKFQVEFISILSNLWLHMKNIMWQTIQRTWEDPVLYSFWKLMVCYVCGIITTLCSKFTWWLSAGWIRNGGGHNLPNVHTSSMFKY